MRAASPTHAMNTIVDQQSKPPAQRSGRARFELIFASACVGFGLFALPALIYLVGTLLFGAYGEGRGLGTFYWDWFSDLAAPAGRAWILALGPLLLLYVLRLLFLGAQPPNTEAEDEDQQAEPGPAPTPPRARVEPRVSDE